MVYKDPNGFSPRNGVVILKKAVSAYKKYEMLFQSPQWGSNSKELFADCYEWLVNAFQSPQWGSNSKEYFSS